MIWKGLNVIKVALVHTLKEFHFLTDRTNKLKYYKTDHKTQHIKFQLLHVSAPKCHPQGVYFIIKLKSLKH